MVDNIKVLNKGESYVKYDPQGMRNHLNGFTALCRRAWEEAGQVKLPKSYKQINKIVILGMGGSAIGGDLMLDYLTSEVSVPLVLHRGYQLPGYADDKTLIIASSYSGKTEETVFTLKEAFKRNAKKIIITTGGELKKIAEQNDLPAYIFDYDSQPRAAMPFILFSILSFLTRLGVVGDKQKDVNKMFAEVEDITESCGESVPFEANKAKKIALKLHGRLPVIYGVQSTAKAAYRWKTQINENSKAWAFYNTFSELNHNAMEGYFYPAEISKMVTVVILRPDCIIERNSKRIELTAELLKKAGIDHMVLPVRGSSELSQMLRAVLFGDYVSYYLAILYKTDPTPIDSLNYLKSRLSEGL